MDDDSELVSCTEAEQMEWLQNVQNSGKPKKLLIELLFKRAELLASIKKMKIEEDCFRNINQSKKSEEVAKSTLQEIATSSKTLIHEDVLQENVGFGLRETRIINFKVDDIPKLYVNDRDRVDEWIYLVETEARTQGIIRSRLKDCVTKLLRGNVLQMLRNMQKRDESVTWEKFKNQLLATLKPADNGKNSPGLSSKQVKRVESQASRYMYDLKEDLIFYFDKKGCALIVPKPDLRTEIIEKSHVLGHFQKETTVKRIREEYFWKNIDRDVEQYILACDICKRNNLIALKEHPAKTLNIPSVPTVPSVPFHSNRPIRSISFKQEPLILKYELFLFELMYEAHDINFTDIKFNLLMIDIIFAFLR
ncbi:pol [Brachionus plicatilis]|uniref:Pol n=1 Tax=Brachionus plicatilis TaxID=10195 RepID=A0A3M7QW23_BRAPC|nr:pol [Brachionus plicatilis]